VADQQHRVDGLVDGSHVVESAVLGCAVELGLDLDVGGVAQGGRDPLEGLARTLGRRAEREIGRHRLSAQVLGDRFRRAAPALGERPIVALEVWIVPARLRVPEQQQPFRSGGP
jgi:hypothetical protein